LEESLEALGPVAAICLTAACSQRSAWRYRKRFGVKVYAPVRSRAMEEQPDEPYTAGQRLPGRLEVIHAPGPESAHYAFLGHGKGGVLFWAGLLSRTEAGPLDFIPPALHDDPAATRDSVRRLFESDYPVLCLSHRAPIKRDPHAALRKVLREDGEPTE
jgi:glyoxylase-like metal-dependent hydrolase (beta-lactamase superfamily II)